MKSNKIILGMSALLVLSQSALNIASADYKEVPEKIASTMLGGAVCQCGGPNDPDCRTDALPEGEIGETTQEECFNIGKMIFPYDPGNKLHICQDGIGGGCANGQGNGGCNSRRVFTIWNTTSKICRYGGGYAVGGLVSTHCRQL